ncbi:MAG: ABC transporter permease subunit [Coriobacteriales bacterium]|jgi:putative spermidine/putrescine transport system permease protein|nr:ABC transporter permease subunit [Coriobacteriales bacterium]
MRQRVLATARFLPLIVLMAGAYVLPVFNTVRNSFLAEDGAFVGFGNYMGVLGSYYFLDTLLFTLKVSLIATALAMIVAVLVALALRETFVGKRVAVFLCQLNLTIPHMAAAMIMALLLSQTGFLSAIAKQLGLIDGARDFPWLIHDVGGIGIIVAFVWKFFPYIAISVLGILQGASREYEHQAATLGVGATRRFFHVVLPGMLPATTVAAIITFSMASGDYEIPVILGAAQHRMLPVLVYLKYRDVTLRDQPEAYVLMIMMILVQMVVILLYNRLASGKTSRRR